MTYFGSPIYRDSEYLTHHGILGMKWGVRRFQNEDGTLTSAGKRRYRKLEKQEKKIRRQEEKLNKKKERMGGESEISQNIAKKSVFDMTDDEINKEIARMDLEKKYREHLQSYQSAFATPVKESKLRTAGREAVNDIIKPALTTVAKQSTEKAMGMTINKIGNSLGLKRDLYYTKDWKDAVNSEVERAKAEYDYKLNKLKYKSERRDKRRQERRNRRSGSS